MKWNFCTKLQLPPEPLTKGLPPPDPRSLCPLSSTEFVEPPPNKIPGYATGQAVTLHNIPERRRPGGWQIYKPKLILILIPVFNNFFAKKNSVVFERNNSVVWKMWLFCN